MSGILSHHSAWTVGPQAGIPSLGGSPERVYAGFSSPWHNKGMQTGQLTIQQMFDFARFLWKHDPTFQQAIKRVVGYFLTDLEFYDPTHKAELKAEDINSYRQVLEGKLNVKFALSQILENYCLYGNVILSLLPPIARRAECPHCRIIHPLSVILSADNPEFKFKYYPKGAKFEAVCTSCGKRGNWNVFDVLADYRKNISLNIYNPYHFTIECDQFSDRRLYTWNIPGDLKNAVKEGNALRLLHTPLSVLKAIGDDKPFLFNDDILLHLREPEVVGFDVGGWGIPQAMFCFSTSRYVFGLRKMNEVLASDYMIPTRLFSPEHPPKDGGRFIEGGVTDMADFNQQIRSIVAQQRRDPAAVHTVNTPVKYQVLGAEGKDLVPGELLLQGEDMQLNAMGVPPQFHRGDLTLQTAPMAARLFEAHWQHIGAAANTFLTWLVEKITPKLGWKEFGVRLTPPKIADNMDQLMLLMQMMQSGEVTATTVLNKLGLDRTEEQRRKLDESIESAKIDVEGNEEVSRIAVGNTVIQQSVEQQRAMEAGGAQGAPAQGMPAGPPPADPVAQLMARIQMFGSEQTPVAITDLYQTAQEAAALFINLPELDKRDKLRQIDQINKPMADMIRSQMDVMHKQQNRQFIAQGQAMMQQQGGMA